MSMRKTVLLIMALALSTTQAWAQATSGSIVGTVTDSSGAFVASAAVVVTNLDTGAAFKTTTSNTGDFAATPIGVGRYSVQVEARGFKSEISTNIVVNVQDRLRLDFKLQI